MQLHFVNIIALASLAIASPLGDVIRIHSESVPQSQVGAYVEPLCLNKCYWNPPGCLEGWVIHPIPFFLPIRSPSSHLSTNVEEMLTTRFRLLLKNGPLLEELGVPPTLYETS